MILQITKATKNIQGLTNFFDHTLFYFNTNLELKISHLIEIAIVVIVAIVSVNIIKKSLYKSRKIDIGKKYSLTILIKYVIYIITFTIIFDILGFDLKIVLAGSAALLVGVGLGLQNLFSDFVSGLILLVDSSVKVGDIIDINGMVCQVEQINLRTTKVMTRDDKFILLPNTLLTKNKLINWTYSTRASRFDVSVRAQYDSNPEKIKEILLSVTESNENVLSKPAPFIRLNNFGLAGLEFNLYFWCDNVFRVENVKSDLRIQIYDQFHKQGINIPLPQQVVHLNDSKSEAE